MEVFEFNKLVKVNDSVNRVLVFSNVDAINNSNSFEKISRFFPHAEILEIRCRMNAELDEMRLICFRNNEADFSLYNYSYFDSDLYEFASSLAENLENDAKYLVFSNLSQYQNDILLHGINAREEHYNISGLTLNHQEENNIFYKGEAQLSTVAVVRLNGNFTSEQLSFFEPYGPTFNITHSENDKIIEIDSKPAKRWIENLLPSQLSLKDFLRFTYIEISNSSLKMVRAFDHASETDKFISVKSDLLENSRFRFCKGDDSDVYQKFLEFKQQDHQNFSFVFTDQKILAHLYEDDALILIGESIFINAKGKTIQVNANANFLIHV